jgi:Skp family chaperone for outer membrane proteins
MKQMKNKIAFLLVAILISAAAQAQGGGGGNFRQRTVEERVKSVHEKMDSAFKLDAEKLAKVDSAFANYYRQQDKMREEMRAGGERTDPQVMRDKMQGMADTRDKEIKPLLTNEQFKKWKEEIEPALMPRRQGGGGGPRNN